MGPINRAWGRSAAHSAGDVMVGVEGTFQYKLRPFVVALWLGTATGVSGVGIDLKSGTFLDVSGDDFAGENMLFSNLL